jgi:hypothetical protein
MAAQNSPFVLYCGMQSGRGAGKFSGFLWGSGEFAQFYSLRKILHPGEPGAIMAVRFSADLLPGRKT